MKTSDQLHPITSWDFCIVNRNTGAPTAIKCINWQDTRNCAECPVAQRVRPRVPKESVVHTDVLPTTGKPLRDFGTGAVRDNVEGKGRCDLLMPLAILEVAKRLEQGAAKYSARNWENGIPMSAFVDSGLRHLLQFMSDDRSEDHLCAAAWNLMAALETRQRIRKGILDKALEDMPKYHESDNQPCTATCRPTVSPVRTLGAAARACWLAVCDRLQAQIQLLFHRAGPTSRRD